ncbi:MAG TPA: hypothetical protein VFY36_10570 [Solirubrobacteraceae bacterium]|nr:hypothetical protein [Solirubrobacteraceae bacterium]
MRQRPQAISSIALLLLTLALAGCGSSPSPHINANIPFKSPAIARHSIPAEYTCDGRNVHPPLQWGEVPSGARELALFVLGLTPNQSTGRYRFTIEWGLAGVNPSLHKLTAGELSAGAHAGLNHNGKTHYSICPAKGKRKLYQFALYTVPPSLTVPQGFTDRELFKLVTYAGAPNPTRAGGAFKASYKRK